MRAIVMCVLVAGCVDNGAWNLPAKLTPAGPATFGDAVSEAAAAWNAALAGCAKPFVMATDGHAVELVPAAIWTDGSDHGAWENSERIEIEDLGIEAWWEPAALHELGHAMGLDHVDPAVDPLSVMKPLLGTLRAPSAGDTQRARALLGC